jgi:hypothetical protein
MSRDGRQVPLDQLGHSEIRFEEPILKRRDRTPVISRPSCFMLLRIISEVPVSGSTGIVSAN